MPAIPPPIEPPPLRPQPLRTLPGRAAVDTDQGVRAGMVTRILLSLTVVFGQLWALVAGLDRYLLGEDGQAWALFAFSFVSFLVVLALVVVHPAPRRNETRFGRSSTQADGLYVARDNSRPEQG